MGRLFLFTSGLLTLCVAVLLAGCTSKTTSTPSQTTPKGGVAQSEATPADKPAQRAEEDPGVTKALAKLSAEDRAIAPSKWCAQCRAKRSARWGRP